MGEAAASSVAVYVLDGAQANKALTAEVTLEAFVAPYLSLQLPKRTLCLPDGSRREVCLDKRPRQFPPALRYDTRGLELFERATQQEDEYYLTACERAIFKTRMEAVAKHIPNGASIIELGCGSMTKTALILDHLRSKAKKTGLKFYALDIDGVFLRRSLAVLKADEESKGVSPENMISYAGLHGSYEQAVAYLPKIPEPRVVLFLGSSIGTMSRADAADMLRGYGEKMGPRDMFLVGIDKRNDPKIISRAYNDKGGFIKALGMNNLRRLNALFGYEAFNLAKFDRLAGYNEEEGQVESYIQSLETQTVTIPPPYSGLKGQSVAVELKKDELILYHIAVKYSEDDLHSLAVAAGMVLTDMWTDPNDMYYFCMFQKAAAEE